MDRSSWILKYYSSYCTLWMFYTVKYPAEGQVLNHCSCPWPLKDFPQLLSSSLVCFVNNNIVVSHTC